MTAAAFEQRDQLRADVAASRKAAEKKLFAYEEVLKDCLKEAACKPR